MCRTLRVGHILMPTATSWDSMRLPREGEVTVAHEHGPLAGHAAHRASMLDVASRRRRVTIGVVATALVSAVHGLALASTPSVETLRIIDAAVVLMDERDLYADYTVEVSSVRSKPDGSDRKSDVVEFAVQKRGAGLPDVRLLRHDRDGEDHTEPSLERIAEIRRDAADGDESERELRWTIGEALGLRPPRWVRFLAHMVLGEDWDRFNLRLPGERERDTYEFTPLSSEADGCIAAFQPTPEHRKDVNIVRGRFAWDCESGMPLWVEANAISLPVFVREMSLRLDFNHRDDIPYTRVLIARGMGGFLFFFRRFETGVKIDDVRALRRRDAAGMEQGVEQPNAAPGGLVQWERPRKTVGLTMPPDELQATLR